MKGVKTARQQKPNEQTGGKPLRFPEIDEKHDSGLRRAIPGLVLIGVVKMTTSPSPAVHFVFALMAMDPAQSDRDEAAALRCKGHGGAANTFRAKGLNPSR